MSPVLKEFWSGLTDLIYPPLCVLCKNPLSPIQKKDQICSFCQSTIMPNRPPFCSLCSRPLADPYSQFCVSCERRPQHFDKAWASCLYNDPMRRLIHLFKYGQKTHLQYFFVKLVNEFLEKFHVGLTDYDLMVAVPLHSARLRERGYNQAHLLAERFSQQWATPLSLGNVARIRNTRNQATLSQKERWTNIHGAFRIKSPSEFDGKKILIIDDLLTTGATLNEMAKVLKNSGARHVGVLTVAVAPG